MSDSLWYKDAIIYQAHVRAFLDSSHDGVGDFRGLTDKLDYLEALGINALWLLPFYPSPLKDDGYDIADYRNINPAYGTLADFDRFIDEAHRRKIRVITELVINHTSDQHPWFQAARRAPAGSREREFYVWSETNQKYQGVPIIFSDTEKSNWTWDEVAGAYYWHRFFHHQPDLNFDNPEVIEAVLEVMHFWLDRGVDGMRLDAVPYLIEREGTPCANLDETHAVLKRIRRAMDQRHKDRLLLAEANQWPADVRPYFGDGDECHMAFHFPLMPRMFMAVRQEDRHPIVEILRQTPDIPDACQWGLFLRNHDELTLEMVTDEERDYMYQWYASDPQMLINGGIRRRLAPLMENSRRRIELMTSLLFSLPGTPVIYYGDELGMGDNIYLGDRNTVRTPMQWTGDRNGGFSRADSARLYAPLITDPVYGYAAVNVEAQERSPFSLLNWMKRMIGLRKQHAVFGRGTIEFLPAQNRKILAYVRRLHDETVLCVANLSRTVQPVELDLARFRGLSPVELLGQTEFPRIGDQPYFLSLGAYAFNWFKLQPASAPITERTSSETTMTAPEVPALMVGTVWDTLLDGTVRGLIERDLLVPFLVRQPWFQGARPRAARFKDWGLLRRGQEPLYLTTVDVEFDDPAEQSSTPRQYFVPLAVASGDAAKAVQERQPHAVLARVTGARKGVLFDGWLDDRFAEAMLDAVRGTSAIATRGGAVRAELIEDGAVLSLSPPAAAPQIARPAMLPGSLTIGDGAQLTLKMYRRIEPGVHPEIEATQRVTAAGFTRAAPIVATVSYDAKGTLTSSLAMLQRTVESQTDGWTHAMDWLSRFFEQPGVHAVAEEPAPDSLVHFPAAAPPDRVRELMGTYLDIAAAIGRRTAELHLALAGDERSPSFAPEPLGADELATATARAVAQAERTLQALEAALDSDRIKASADTMARLRCVVSRREALSQKLQAAASLRLDAAKIRIHGDYRLAQILFVEGEFYIQNIEGHLSWPASAQREKHSPLRDVAGLLRSFSYASHAALVARAAARPEEIAGLERLAHAWQGWATAAFLQQYAATIGDAKLVPDAAADRDALLRFFMLDRALRELDGELNNRPEWVGIPAIGILELLERG
ncbi:MAG TPA: maltose alpha-D-glucosyltransferase [Vicinamibacterales bacterium]|nr:maltose alpha-D-glucosyltransferase [Vicinamibacterales bacterium]